MKTINRLLLITGMLCICFLFPAGLFAQSNQYLHFDKVDDFVSLDNGSQYIANSNAITMAGWFYTDVNAYGQGMMSFRAAGQGFYMIQLNNGTIECRFQNSAGTLYEFVAPTNTVIPETWQHYAWVYDGSAVKLYKNGNLLGSAAASGAITNAAIQFTIGKCLLSGFNFVFGGRADEVSVWNVALTQTQIQDMMANELTGTETGLQLYYKFNQGDPGGDNTSIVKLISETGAGTRDADLNNFAMTGNSSNFLGTLNTGYQAISFPQIPNKLVSDAPFTIDATATSLLPVTLEIISGPASIIGNTITLTDAPGEVTVKASQPGNGTYNPAVDVVNTFMVLDPATFVPQIEARSPLPGDVFVPSLSPIQLAAISTIDYPELFHVDSVEFNINGTIVPAKNWGNNHFTGWWAPPSYGNFTIDIVAKNNYGASGVLSVNINVVPTATNQTVTAAQNIWLSSSSTTETVEAELPSFLGAYDVITATLTVHCPTGGCGEWDRVASIDAKGHNGKWIEIIRYITPYGVECDHTVDLTDYMSLLQGKISFRLNCATLDNGYLYDLAFNYHTGTPVHKYSNVDVIWQDTYPFGDYSNLQPVENVNVSFPSLAKDAKLKIMNTGHGWGALNTDNAAEFYEATHKIKINGDNNDQHLWVICNPNPDGCQPQNGTWYNNRAGWCPGSISKVFNYSLTTYLTQASVMFQYEFYPDYIDQCHPNNPNCETGVTCTDCSDGFNPNYIITGNLITWFDEPFDTVALAIPSAINNKVQVYPNPSFGEFWLNSEYLFHQTEVSIYDMSGCLVTSFKWDGSYKYLDFRAYNKGIYNIVFNNQDGKTVKRVVIQ